MEAGRPQTKLQRSRKGKRAWRKNVDIQDVETGLNQKQEHERVFGKDFAENDFVLDTEGDHKLIQKSQPKKLKSLEILDRRSKFPALNVERTTNKKVQGVSKKEIGRLMKLSGRHQGMTASQARLLQDGLVNTTVDDLWAAEAEDKSPEVLKKFSSTEWTKPSTQPKTLKENPIGIKVTNDVINSGKSYNPSFESWKALLNEEFVKESSNEEKRQLLKEHQERIKNLIATMNDNEEIDSTDDEEKDVPEADEEESIETIKLSINKPTQVKIKTKSKRNRERKHKEREDLEKKLKELKFQIHELEKLEVYEEEVSQKLSSIKKKVAKPPKKLFKYNNLGDQLEIKLSDEISDSLRKLKPEGNLLYDEMKKLQNSGKVEARIPVAKRRKYTPKITEKWTYKDFK